MRYGERSLWLAWGAAVLAAAALLPFSAFWRGDSGLLHSFVVMMVIIPVLFGPLVRTLHRSAGALRDAAGADALTGLGNRRTLTTQLHTARQRSVRDQTMLAVMLFDLDNFKRVNDTLGHGAGDRLLIAVADVLRAGNRPGDGIARLGGDEFVVLLQDLPVTTGVALARDRATQLVQQIGAAAQALAPGLAVSASAGVHCWTGSPESAAAEAGPLDESDLLIQADRAMYECKRAGKGRVAITILQAVGTPVTARPPAPPGDVQPAITAGA